MLIGTLIPYATGELLGFPEYQHQIKGILLYTLYLHSGMSKNINYSPHSQRNCQRWQSGWNV